MSRRMRDLAYILRGRRELARGTSALRPRARCVQEFGEADRVGLIAAEEKDRPTCSEAIEDVFGAGPYGLHERWRAYVLKEH